MSDNTMALAQAIRQGAQLGEQCHGTYFYRGGSCALGAAYLAMGRDEDDIPNALEKHFPELLWWIEHPVDGYRMPLTSVIVSLNDEHLWTREQIADWIEATQLVAPIQISRTP